MGYELRDIQATAITDPTACPALTATAGEWAAVSGSVIADLATLSGSFSTYKTAIDAILVAIENVGIVAKA